MKKSILLTFALALTAIAIWFGQKGWLEISFLQSNLENLTARFDQSPTAFILMYAFVYTVMVAFFLPGLFIMNLVAGAIFGPFIGTSTAVLAATAGSIVAFLLSRYVFQEWAFARFPKQADSVDQAFRDMGGYYVFLLRLVPGLPIGLTNILLGVTSIHLITFGFATLLGTIPWTAFYVIAGVEIASIKSVDDIISTETTMLALCLIVFLAGGQMLTRKYVARRTMQKQRTCL
ncbi:TVP38/TMEM64 family protein [Kordiimonas pumila]|uniref:TVP38/TMEM64 family membrane protein n=1 Tax=Kordiimonas pumila TaxID=2161677 RepID=A0ABV7D419_9PROT|nr:TVP38/TMEM64 family protein [Kordiimonas pumila]